VGTPASCNGVVAVAALRHVGTKVGFSDLGSQIAISAPGGNCINIGANEPCLYPILAALNAGLTVPETSIWSDSYDATVGTSFASPLAAGVAALVLSQNPSLTVAQVRALLQGSARPFPATGGSPDARGCNAPAKGVQQLECYCPNPGTVTYPLCGAGMLDAGAAVNAAATGLAIIDTTPSGPLKGEPLTLGSSRSIAGAGRNIVGWSWSIVSGGGAVGGFTSATNGASATLAPSAAGTIVVRLTITDNTGASTSSTASVTVSEPPPPADTGKGGGAISLLWLALLALAVLALVQVRRRGDRR
jgi:serine protease